MQPVVPFLVVVKAYVAPKPRRSYSYVVNHLLTPLFQGKKQAKFSPLRRPGIGN